MMDRSTLRALCASGLFAAFGIGMTTAAAAGTPARPPAGMDDVRFLEKGQWGLTYRYSRVAQDGNRIDEERVSTDEVLDLGYEATATERTLQTHLIGAQYSPWSALSVFVELPIHVYDATYLTATDATTGDSTGIGDFSVGALVRFMEKDLEDSNERIVIGARIITPTGSAVKNGDFSDLGGGVSRYPYPMQLGSGSWAFTGSLSYLGRRRATSWGGQLRVTTPMEDNDQGYRLGNTLEATGWIGQGWRDWVEVTLRAHWTRQHNIRGADSQLDPDQVPSADPDLQGGHRIDMGPGLNFGLPWTGGSRFAFEALFPVFQSLDGPQVEADSRLAVSWNWAF